MVVLTLFSRFWFFKFLILIGITVGAFFIPDGTFHTGTNILSYVMCLYFEQTLAYWWLRQLTVLDYRNNCVFSFAFHSVVLFWSGGVLHLHSNPTYSPHRLCSLLEQGVGRKCWKQWQQMLVCRYSFKRIGVNNIDYFCIYIWKDFTDLHHFFLKLFTLMYVDVISRLVVFHCPSLLPGYRCCGSILCLLHKAWWLYRAQSLHQPQLDLLYHHLHCFHPTQNTGTVWTSVLSYLC